MIGEIRTQRRILMEQTYPHMVGLHIGEKVLVPVQSSNDRGELKEATVVHIDKDWNFVVVQREPAKSCLSDPFSPAQTYRTSYHVSDIRRHRK